MMGSTANHSLKLKPTCFLARALRTRLSLYLFFKVPYQAVRRLDQWRLFLQPVCPLALCSLI